MATNPPARKIMPESRSNIKEKKPSFTNVNTLTSRNNAENCSNKRSITKNPRLTFKTQIPDRRQFQGITIIINLVTDIFISLCRTQSPFHPLFLTRQLNCDDACVIKRLPNSSAMIPLGTCVLRAGRRACMKIYQSIRKLVTVSLQVPRSYGAAYFALSQYGCPIANVTISSSCGSTKINPRSVVLKQFNA